MLDPTSLKCLLATCFALPRYFSLTAKLIVVIVRISALILKFRESGPPPTPTSTHDFETQLHKNLAEAGRIIFQWCCNSIEKTFPDSFPQRICFQGTLYRKRFASFNQSVFTLFGQITLKRTLYQSCNDTEHSSIFLLEMRLGLEVGCTTPALTDRISLWINNRSQQQTLAILAKEYYVSFSVDTLRKITDSISKAIAEVSLEINVEQLLAWLDQANKSSGSFRVVFSVGRDGIFLPMRGHEKSKEASTATITIYDRNKKRLGTIYLARMPEAGQTTLDEQLTKLIEETLKRWEGPMPELAYVTDSGYHQNRYFFKELKRMKNPKNKGERLNWTKVVDFWHMSEYIKKLANEIFGEGQEAANYAEKWRHWAKHEEDGLGRVLRSAGALRKKRGLQGSKKGFDSARQYIKNNMKFGNYKKLRSVGIPIGSGVTEAACKTVFTQRLKCSGMKWSVEGGQRILNLRVAILSKTWKASFAKVMTLREYPELRTQAPETKKGYQNAA